MKKIISIFIVLSVLLSGCARESTQQARSVCESYMEKMHLGEYEDARGYVDPSLWTETLDLNALAEQAGYNEEVKKMFVSYMNYVVSKQWVTYKIKDATMKQGTATILAEVTGISAEDLLALDTQAIVDTLNEKIQNGESTEGAFKTYFEACQKQVDTLDKHTRIMEFQVSEKNGQWLITGMNVK